MRCRCGAIMSHWSLPRRSLIVVISTLLVSVNGAAWSEPRSLAGAPPASPILEQPVPSATPGIPSLEPTVSPTAAPAGLAETPATRIIQSDDVTPMPSSPASSGQQAGDHRGTPVPSPSSATIDNAIADALSMRDILPTAADFGITCDPTSITASASIDTTVTCVITSATETPVTIDSVAVSSLPGWTISFDTGNLAEAGWVMTPDAPVSSARSYAFAFSLTPSCEAPAKAQPIGVTTLLASNDGTFAPLTIITAARSESAVASTSITDADLDAGVAYSPQPQEVMTSLTYRINASGCSEWNVQVAASDFTYAGEHADAYTDPLTLQLASSSLTAVSGEAIGVTQTPPGSLEQPLDVLSAAPGRGIGVFDQTLNLITSVPGGAPAGSYSSTVTITITGDGNE